MGLSSSSPIASSYSSPPPLLPYDIWYLVAEKLLFLKRDEGIIDSINRYQVDLRHQNAFTSFMLASQTTYRAFMAQFARIREIHFRGRILPGITMYREGNCTCNRSRRRNQEDKQFYGPYLVTESFVNKLVDLRKLNLTSLNTVHYLGRWVNSERFKPGNFAIQSFCKLFLDKELSNEEATEIRFELNKLDVLEDNNVIEAIFDELLNLNSKSVYINMDTTEPIVKLFDCSSFDRSIDANRTEKIFIPFCSDESKISSELGPLKIHWESLIDYLLDKCSAIRQIKFELDYVWRLIGNHDEFIAHFGQMLNKFTEHIFPGLAKGSREARISVKLDVYCREQYEVIQDKIRNHCNKGKPLVIERHSMHLGYIARECQVTDKLGRVHKFTFVFRSLYI